MSDLPYSNDGTEQNEETTNGNTTSMSNSYQFIGTTEQDDDNNDEQYNTVGNLWTLGDHTTASDEDTGALTQAILETMGDLDGEIDEDMMAVLEDAHDSVQTTRVSEFECSVCGLGHGHPDHKHDIRESGGLNVTDEFADQLDFCPYCHCGVNELSMLMPFFGYISETVFNDEAQFDAVNDLPADVLKEAVQDVISGDKTKREAAMAFGPNGEVHTFLSRVQTVKSAASAAPIAQETRTAITNNRIELDKAIRGQ